MSGWSPEEDEFTNRPWRSGDFRPRQPRRASFDSDVGQVSEEEPSGERNFDESSDALAKSLSSASRREDITPEESLRGMNYLDLSQRHLHDAAQENTDDDASRGTLHSESSPSELACGSEHRLRSAGLSRRRSSTAMDPPPPALDTVAFGSQSMHMLGMNYMKDSRSQNVGLNFTRNRSSESIPSSDEDSTKAMDQTGRERTLSGFSGGDFSLDRALERLSEPPVAHGRDKPSGPPKSLNDEQSDGEHTSDYSVGMQSIAYEADEPELSPLERIGPKALLAMLEKSAKSNDDPWLDVSSLRSTSVRDTSTTVFSSAPPTSRPQRSRSPIPSGDSQSEEESQRAFAESLDRLRGSVESKAKPSVERKSNAIANKSPDKGEVLEVLLTTDRNVGTGSVVSGPFDDATSSFVQSAKMMPSSDPGSDGPGRDTVASSFLSDDAAQEASRNFAVEHRIFIKAVLDLLAQKDKFLTETDENEIDTIKSGPLRKASHLVRGIWKVKYVEIRRGMFSYYEDMIAKDTSQGELIRKNIPLQADCYKCRPVKIHQKALKLSPGGAIFELTVHGGPKRLWMASSREERRTWIQAIQDATVGGSVIRGGNKNHYRGISAKSPYKQDVEMYLRIQREIKHAASKEAYVVSVSKLLGNPMDIPVQWIMKHLGDVSSENAARAFHDEGVASGVDQLWKDLLRDSVRINGELFVGGSGHGPERIVASLMHGILSFDKSSPMVADTAEAQKRRFSISEAQALSYARDILLCGNRTRSGGDSYYCVNTLCNHPALAVIVPSSAIADPLSINVTHVLREKQSSMNDRSGWLRTRSKPHKPWKRRYFVLSEGTLSYYEQALPRPHGLRGQATLLDMTLTLAKRGVSGQADESMRNVDSPDQYIVTIFGKDGFVDRQILLENEEKATPWAYSLDAASRDEKDGRGSSSGRGVFRKFNHRDDVSQPAGVFGSPLKDYASVLDIDENEVGRRIRTQSSSSRGRSTVNISVKASTEYKVCTLDPQGIEEEDTWATIRANFRQSFQVSGGPNGRIIKGDEIVQTYVIDCTTLGASKTRGEGTSTPSRFGSDRIRRHRKGSSNDNSGLSSHSQMTLSGTPSRRRPTTSPMRRRIPTT